MYIKKIFLLLTIFIIVILSSCTSKEAAAPTPALNVTTESDQGDLKNVYDDGYSTVYFKVVDDDNWRNENVKIVELMLLKRKWEEKSLNKKVVAMSVVNGGTGGYGVTYVAGLLIHYEIITKK